MQETQVRSPGQEDPLDQDMATHSSIPAQIIPRTEETGGLQSMGVTKELDKTEHACMHNCKVLRKGQELQAAYQDFQPKCPSP